MNDTRQLSTRARGLVVTAAAAGLLIPLVGAATASTGSPSTAGTTLSTTAKAPKVYTGPSGNTVEVVDPGKSTYIPKVAAASKKNLAKARDLLAGVNKFCSTHTVKQIKANWRPGGMGGMHMKSSGSAKMDMEITHYFNPRKHSDGLHPMSPKAALIYDGRLDGVMLNGSPLPYLGTIPRAHTHEKMLDHPVEMVHVYCTKNLKHAFTPNRTLGVLAPMINLRLKIRPAILDLNIRQLKQVRHMVRDFMGHSMKSTPAVATLGGPDPVKQAMRMEIRKSLMMLTTHQLRLVWNKMQSY